MNQTRRGRRGRRGRPKIGSTMHVLIKGDPDGGPLLATVERNSPVLVVTISESDPI